MSMTTELNPQTYLPPQATAAAAATVAALLPSQPHRACRLLNHTIERTPTDHAVYPALVGAATRLELGTDPEAVAELLREALGGAE